MATFQPCLLARVPVSRRAGERTCRICLGLAAVVLSLVFDADQQLLDGGREQLQQPEVLTRRSADAADRARRRSSKALDSWLTLRDLARCRRPGKFDDFYHFGSTAMRQETRLFTRTDRREPEHRQLFDSDFTYVNKPLARHYG
jgi:hypothetical protein